MDAESSRVCVLHRRLLSLSLLMHKARPSHYALSFMNAGSYATVIRMDKL